jgi:putative component of membrane protein insertase Oxa1/YidC/SpoIIIJ protein YidD
MIKFLRIFVFAIVYLCFLTAQTKHPADTVLTSDKTSLAEKILISPISLWQRFSYSTPLLACQFYPSCSNYAAQSISEKGVFTGTVMAAERIVRCNPSAYHYHLRDNLKILPHEETFHTDGRLIDRVLTPLPAQQNGKSPKLAAVLSALLPGSGRIYAERTWDGIFGFLTFTLSANLAYEHLNSSHTIRGGLFLISSLVFYGGEILGAYRAAQATPQGD